MTATCSRLRCDTAIPEGAATCPACGAKPMSLRRIKALGWLLVGCGVFLIGLMGTITWRMYPSMTQPGVPDAGGTTWNGTAAQGRDALELFALVLAFGAVSLVNGLRQALTGRRSIGFFAVTIVLALALFLTARGIMAD